MLRVLIDESLPKRLRRQLPDVEASGFDAFLTADQSIQYQQNLSLSKLRIIVFATASNRLEHVAPLLPEAIAAPREMAPGELRVVPAPR